MRSSCALAVEGHPSHDPAETKSTHRAIFYSPLIYVLSFLEKKEKLVCFAEASFILHWRKRPLILSCHTSYALIMQALLEDEKKKCIIVTLADDT